MKKQTQTSESFLVSALLATSGGFQDAYTYFMRDQVFSNAQTGNVVLMSQRFMVGQWADGIRYLFPILAFVLGVLVSEQIGFHLKNAKGFHWRQLIILIELVILFIVGFIPTGFNMIATMLVSFTCAMQVQAFRKVKGLGYASTMCIGNLRSGTESLSQFLRTHDKEAAKRVGYYYGIIFIFAIGAGLGGVVSSVMGLRSIWVSSGILLIIGLLMNKGRS